MSPTDPPASGAPQAWNASAAVTGLGAVTAWGWGLDAFWRGLLGGEAAIDEPRHFETRGHRTRLASEVPLSEESLRASDPLFPSAREWRRLSRADRFAVAAAIEAWRAAGLGIRGSGDGGGPGDDGPGVDGPGGDGPGVDGPRVGVFFGGSTAAMAEGEEFFVRVLGIRDGHPRISLLASHPLDGPGNAIARSLGVSGPVESLSSACASGGLALGTALDALRSGEVDIALAGGADALCQLTYSGFNSLRAVDDERCSPFRQQRAGLNLGEGAGMLVLERPERARGRGVEPLAFLHGAGASCDAHHMTAPHPEGEGAARAIEAALGDAGLRDAGLGDGGWAERIAFVNAHGTGTPHNDRAEWRALERVFGARAASIPVTSTKGMVGHFLGSSGAIEAVATVLCLHHGRVHVTPGRGEIDPEIGVDLVVDEPRALDGLLSARGRGLAISTSLAFGGSNAAVVFGPAALGPEDAVLGGAARDEAP